MKILELRLKNLNSLSGEWIIDFTDPHYVSNGIFALTGPTGAGKSTILDAICLALYGRTPRLGNITQSSNEIMSRQSGECSAEVVFESTEGRYRCSWSQAKARKRPDGALQSPRHEIADAVTGKIIEEKKSLVGKVIEEKTGMDFERFTRSILLAQGGFDSFLKADSENKSRILEQITGTSIYSTISKKCFERQREEREKLNLLEAQFSGLSVLSEEDEALLTAELEQKRLAIRDVSGSMEQLNASIRWVQTIAGLDRELAAIEQDMVLLESDKAAFADQKTALERSQQAVHLEPLFVELTNARKLLAETAVSRTAYETELAVVAEECARKETILATANAERESVKSNRAQQLPVIQKVRELDSELAVQRGRWKEIDAEVKTLEQQVVQASKERESLLGQKTQIEHSLAELIRYRSENQQDEQLVSQLSAIEQKMVHLGEFSGTAARKDRELLQKQALLTESRQKQELHRTSIDTLTSSVEEIAGQIDREKSCLSELLAGKAVRDYRETVQSLLREKALLARIASLEEERQRLVDGAPCPLCGSEHHPFAQGNTPDMDAVDVQIDQINGLIGRAEQIEKTIEQLIAEQMRRTDLFTAARTEMVQIEYVAATAELQCADLAASLAVEQQQLEELRAALLTQLAPYGCVDLTSAVIPHLKQRLDHWNRSISEIDRYQKECDRLAGEMSRCDAVISTCAPQIAVKAAEREEQLLRGRCLKKEREDLFGEKNPAEIEQQLEIAVETAEKNVAVAQESYHVTSSSKSRLAENIQRCAMVLEKESPERDRLESEFVQELYRSGFADETAFVRARLSSSERETLSHRLQELIRRETELITKRSDRQARRAEEIAKNMTDLPETQLTAMLLEKKGIHDQLLQESASLDLAMREGISARETKKQAAESIDRQRTEYLRWNTLNELIGSADGKKFRTFAQGLTFELMVGHANAELEKMTDRYILIRDEQQPLELNVIDTYQAGEERSVKNLSGGECFIISLTLALGLSKMASRRVRVDSLFLDEGFGTLDEDSLETALETLSSLNEEGKLIGIISHVAALKERIPTQIQVVPISGGKSALVGPGCSRGE